MIDIPFYLNEISRIVPLYAFEVNDQETRDEIVFHIESYFNYLKDFEEIYDFRVFSDEEDNIDLYVVEKFGYKARTFNVKIVPGVSVFPIEDIEKV